MPLQHGVPAGSCPLRGELTEVENSVFSPAGMKAQIMCLDWSAVAASEKHGEKNRAKNSQILITEISP